MSMWTASPKQCRSRSVAMLVNCHILATSFKINELQVFPIPANRLVPHKERASVAQNADRTLWNKGLKAMMLVYSFTSRRIKCDISIM